MTDNQEQIKQAPAGFWSGVAELGRGFASVFSFGAEPNLSNYPLDPQEAADADARALRSDWEVVGRDLWGAVAQVDAEIRNEEKRP